MLQAFFVVCLRFASGLGTGAVTSFTYAYFVAASLVAVTASSLGLVSSVPLSRAALSDERASRHVVSTSLVSFAAVAAAAGVFALVGEPIVRAALGPAYAGDAGGEIGRLIVLLGPWMAASIGVTITFPLLFVAGRERRLPLLAIAVLLLHVVLTWVAVEAFELDGAALALTRLDGRRPRGAARAALAARPRGERTAARARRGDGRRPGAARLRARRPGSCPTRQRLCSASPCSAGCSSQCGIEACGRPGATCARWTRLPPVLRDLVKRALGAAGRTGVGKNLVNAAVQADPGLKRYPSVERWPESLDGFEDLAFLFSSNQLSHGIASLQLDEAALLYGLARRVAPGAAVAEIGRFKGGTTLMLASALPDGAELWSYDLHVALRADMSGPQLDAELETALDRYGLSERVHLVVGDSRTAEPPPRPCALVFVDGDHTYEGARADYDPLGRARRRRRAPALPRRGRRRRLREPLSGDRAARRGDRAGRRAPRAAAGRRLDRALHAPLLMNLVAVVLSYNGREDTLAALESLRGIETVVVDNGSTDGSADAVAERFPDVELVRAGVNLGFAGGNNVGIRRALDRGADWVLLVNNDAEVEPGIVDALAAAAAARPDAGVLACKVLFADSGRLWYAGADFDPILGRSRHEGFGEADAAGRLEDTRRATGAGMAVSRAAIEAAGLLDEELFLYAEDLEWSLRIREAGFAVVYVPEARVRHRVSSAAGGAGSPTTSYYETRNMLAVVERYRPLPRGLTGVRRGLVVTPRVLLAARRPASAWAALRGWRDYRRGRMGRRG